MTETLTCVQVTYLDGLRFLSVIQEILNSDRHDCGKIRSNTLLLNLPPAQALFVLSHLLLPFLPCILLSGAVDTGQTLCGLRYSLITQHHLLLATLSTSFPKPQLICVPRSF